MRPTYSPITPSESSWMPLKKATTITIVGLPIGNGDAGELEHEVDDREQEGEDREDDARRPR